MSFSPLLSKRISQTQISQILIFVKAPSFFSSAHWYFYIGALSAKFKKVSWGFLRFFFLHAQTPPRSLKTRCSHWQISLLAWLLIDNATLQGAVANSSSAVVICGVHPYSFNRSNLLSNEDPINDNRLDRSAIQHFCIATDFSDFCQEIPLHSHIIFSCDALCLYKALLL